MPSTTPRRPGAKTPKRRTAKNGARERQRTTVYFWPELKKRLAIYCAEHDVEMSGIVNEAVKRFLDRA